MVRYDDSEELYDESIIFAVKRILRDDVKEKSAEFNLYRLMHPDRINCTPDGYPFVVWDEPLINIIASVVGFSCDQVDEYRGDLAEANEMLAINSTTDKAGKGDA